MREQNHLTESYWAADTTEELQHTTLGEVLRAHARDVPERVALVDGGEPDPARRRRWTYAELVSQVESLARSLLTRFRPGEKVAICAPNSPEWILLQLGLSLAGLVLVPINPAYRAAELEVILRSSDAAGIFHTPKFRDNPLTETIAGLRTKLPSLRETHLLEEVDRFAAGADAKTELPRLAPDALLQIQFTSGTAGVPKGAQLHHYGTYNTSRFVALRAGFPDGGVWLNAMPLFHVGGAVVCEFGTWAQRGTFVIAPGFDPGMVLELIESEKVNTTLVVPTMILALLTHPRFSEARPFEHGRRAHRRGDGLGRSRAPHQVGLRLRARHPLRPDGAQWRRLGDHAARQRRGPIGARSAVRCRRPRCASSISKARPRLSAFRARSSSAATSA